MTESRHMPRRPATVWAPGAPTLVRGSHRRGTPAQCLLVRKEHSKCPEPGISAWGLLCPGGPGRAGRPHWGLAGPGTWGISLTLCGGTPCPQSPGRLGWDPPSTTRKETMVTISWLSGGLCGRTSRVVRVWGQVSGHPYPVSLGQPGLLHSHLGLQLVGARGAGQSPPAHVSPPGAGADPATLTPSPNYGTTQSLCSWASDPSPQPHNHPNLSLWASDLQRPPGTSGRAASTHLSPDPQAHRTETHTMGTQDASGPLVLSARLPPPCPPSHPPRGPTDRQSPWGC